MICEWQLKRFPKLFRTNSKLWDNDKKLSQFYHNPDAPQNKNAPMEKGHTHNELILLAEVHENRTHLGRF